MLQDRPWGGGSWAVSKRVSRNWLLPAPLEEGLRISYVFRIAFEQ